MAYNLQKFGKEITVAKLRAVLDGMDGTLVLVPNMVGNLTVMRDEKYIGRIDISTEAFELNAVTEESGWQT